MRTNNQAYILHHLQKLSDLPISEALGEKANETLIRNLEAICEEIFEKIPVVEEQ